MNNKRRDKQNRVLREGEYQKSNGLYEYRYRDKYNVERSVYSWRLTASDAIPKGKRKCEPLRDMEVKIGNDLHDEIDSFVSKSSTLNDRFEVYINGKVKLKSSTRTNYIYMYNKYAKDTIGRMRMEDLNYSNILQFYNSLITEYGFKPRSMEVMHTILNPIFDNAEMDGIIRKNPCKKAMKELRSRADWKADKRVALTLEQQKTFMGFIKNHTTYSVWTNVFTVLLGTGMRIGEFTGLTENDCDFETGQISVNHSLIYRPCADGHSRHRVETPKTLNGIRTIPMFDEVRQALLDEINKHNNDDEKVVIDGMTGWVFTNRYGRPFTPKSINGVIERVCNAYNAEETEKAKKEHRIPVLLPHFSAHHLRHTFCTRLIEQEPRAKVVQSIMGHADISTTMDIYADVEERLKKESISVLQGKVFVR